MAGQQWVRLDVGYFSNPKVLRAGKDAALLHLAAICYLGAHEIDSGILQQDAVRVLVACVNVRGKEAVAQLQKCGLWHPSDDGGWIVHDYDVTNGGRSEAAYARERQRRRRARQRTTEHEGPDHEA